MRRNGMRSASFLVSVLLIIVVVAGLFYPWYPQVSQGLQTQQFPYSYPIYAENRQQRDIFNRQQIQVGKFNAYTGDWYVTVGTITLDAGWRVTVSVEMDECWIYCSVSVTEDFGYKVGVFTIGESGTGHFIAPDTGTYVINALNIDSRSAHRIQSIRITATIPGYITETRTATFQVTTWKISNSSPYSFLESTTTMLIFGIALIPLIIVIAIRTRKRTRRKRKKQA